MCDFLVYAVGHSIANLRDLHNSWHNITYNGVVFRAFIYCFYAPGATLNSYFNSSAYRSLCDAPKPDLTLVFMGGNDITQNTVVRELQDRIIQFCEHIESLTTVPCKVFFIEPRTRLRGVDYVSYNRIRNLLNRNFQHKDRTFFPNRYVITPLRFEFLSTDGVHPNAFGEVRLNAKVLQVIGSHLYTHHLFED